MAPLHFPRSLIISFALLPLSSFVLAQTTIDPSSVPLILRSQWCEGQMNTCGTLCSGYVDSNSCSPVDLSFACTCSSNQSAPGLAFYKNTMLTFICEDVFANCVTAGMGNVVAQAACTKNEKANCGHLNPYNFVPEAGPAVTISSSSSTTTTSSSSTSGATSTGVSSSGGSTSSSHQSSSKSQSSSTSTLSSSTTTSTDSTQSSFSASSSSASSNTASPTQSPTSTPTPTPTPNSSPSSLSTSTKASIAIVAIFGALLL